MADPYRIRPAEPADAPALSAIERRCFTDPWSPAGFQDALATAGGFGVAAVRNAEVLGYLIARVVADEAEILNLAVTPDARRRGIGSALLHAGLDHCTRHHVTAVFLEVRESNRQARALYGAHGFRAVGQRAGYYRNPPEDAMVLRLTLGGVA